MTVVDSWHGLRAGDQVGNLEYVVDEPALAQYRKLVGVDGCFPNLMAEDCRAMLGARAPGETLTTVWQRLDFMRPPILGRRIQVGGWLREARHARDRIWIRAAAFAVDEIGTEILRSEAAFEVGREYPQCGPIVEAAPMTSSVNRLANGRAGDSGHLGRVRLPGQDALAVQRILANAMVEAEMPGDGNGLTAIAAGWLETILGGDFGEDFRWGGKLSIAYHGAIWPGSELRCDGVVLGHDTDVGGVDTRRVVMSVRDAADRRVATAEAVVKSPSPLLQ